MRIDVLVGPADDFEECGSARVGAKLALCDFAAVEFSPGEGVVECELGGFSVAMEVDAGVADVGEVEVFGCEPGEGEGGCHAFF